MKTPHYFDKCAEAVLSLRQQHLEDRTLGPEINRGGAFVVHSLGTAVIKDEIVPIAAKLSFAQRGQPYQRLLTDLSFSALIDSYAPEVSDKLPLFVAGLTVGDRFEPKALLTEDVSDGGRLEVRSQPVSKETETHLAHGLAEFGTPAEIFDMEEMHRTLAFNVGGKEKFLDFDPWPINNVPRHRELLRSAIELSEDGRFFVNVDEDSTLAKKIIH